MVNSLVFSLKTPPATGWSLAQCTHTCGARAAMNGSPIVELWEEPAEELAYELSSDHTSTAPPTGRDLWSWYFHTS
ncbi:MAG: hypothetical protein WAJ93_06540 [Candidatus Nitrosopolaris sp.]